MNTTILKSSTRALRLRSAAWLWVAALALGQHVSTAQSTPTVTTLGGGLGASHIGFTNGYTFTQAAFNTPQGIALDPSGTRLFIADFTNNAVRMINNLGANGSSWTYTLCSSNNGVTRPVAVLVDAVTNVYVLSRSLSGTNGNLMTFNGRLFIEYGLQIPIATNSTSFTNATAMAMDGLTNIYVTCQSNRVLRVQPSGLVTIIGIITNAGTNLRGVAVLDNGTLALTDAGNNGIWLMNPYTGSTTNNATKFTGFHGAADTNGPPAYAAFNRPENIAKAGGGFLVVADRMNHKVKLVDKNGSVTRLFGVSSNIFASSAVTFKGWFDGTVNPNEVIDPVQSREPVGLAIGSDGSIYDTEDYYHIIRKATGTGLTGPGTPGTPPPFNNPSGIALNNSSDTIYITDPTNNVVFRLDLLNNTTTTFLTSADGIYQPVDVAVDTANNLYVLNQGAGSTNGSIYVYDEFGNFLENYAGGLTLPTALSFDAQDKLFVTSLNGKVQSFTGTSSNTIVNISTNSNVALQGVAVFDSGKIAVSDAGNNVIWLIDPAAPLNYIRLSGGVGLTGTNYGNSAQTRLNKPQRIAFADGNKIIVADSGNNRLVVVQSSGTITNSLITTNGTLWFGRSSDPVGTSSGLYVAMNAPVGVAIGNGGNVYASEATYKDIRGIANTGILPPPGPPPPPSAPTIGYVTFISDGNGGLISKLNPVTAQQTFNNNVIIAILPATNTSSVQTYYTSGQNNVADPSKTNGSSAEDYTDGSAPVSVKDLPVVRYPTTIIRATSVDSFGSSSPITTSTFLFETANPSITGNNAAQFTVSCLTTNAKLFYTIDGTDPTNDVGGSSFAVPLDGNLSLNISTNTTFKIRAYNRPSFKDSSIVTAEFSSSNFVANTISFGFASGEASSDFVASPGQTFYAPVTLSLLPSVKMYSLQFNLTVTNVGASPPVASGAFNFESFLKKPDLTLPGYYIQIPPFMFASSGINPAPSSSSFLLNGDWYQSLNFTNTGNNLLAVGWLERLTRTNLYDTKSQDLVTYSFAHDTMFLGSAGKVEVGGYGFQVPLTATNGSSYQIQIGRPSATADGVGAPGSDVFISAPTNGSTAGGGPISALKYVTVGQRKYIAGSVYPFRWFNAGDFGSSNLVNADVEQVYQSAIDGPVRLNVPPPGTDFYDAMDSCGSIGVLNKDATSPNFGYYTNSFSSLNQGQVDALFSGDDTSINQIAFGDGVLDVCDVYVTFRRSLDPSLTWYRRFWNKGFRVADTNAPNIAPHIVSKALTKSIQPKALTVSTTTPRVNFAAGDVQGSAGQVVQIPITANIVGNYPLRLLLLNLTVQPLDSSPALTTPVQFNQTAAIGAPYTTDSKGNGNYSAAWLNRTNVGLTGTVTIGTLAITIPTGVSSNAAYAIYFDHASASPNGLASFPKQTLTGLVTLSARTNSSYGDTIPDSWRLRWFGTANNYLSTSNACPSGDGISNWKKFVAGVDPNVANNFPSVNPKAQANTGYTSTIHWPTVSGKQYVIERSADLFNGWSTISTNTGNGGDLEYNDSNTGKVKFYRVRILP